MTDRPADAGWDASRPAAGTHNPWLVTLILSMATFMTVLDTSIANVALLSIAGALGTSVDESTWIITSSSISKFESYQAAWSRLYDQVWTTGS